MNPGGGRGVLLVLPQKTKIKLGHKNAIKQENRGPHLDFLTTLSYEMYIHSNWI